MLSIDSGALSSISIISHSLDKGYQVCPCLSIKCNNRGLLLSICLSLNLSLKGIITESGKLLTFPLQQYFSSLFLIYPIPYFCVN